MIDGNVTDMINKQRTDREPTPGTLTRVGYVWKCEKCGKLSCIAGDSISPVSCDECGGNMIDAPADEALGFEKKLLIRFEKAQARDTGT